MSDVEATLIDGLREFTEALESGEPLDRRYRVSKRSIRDLAEKHGIDLSTVKDQGDQIDILTGKRVSWE